MGYSMASKRGPLDSSQPTNMTQAQMTGIQGKFQLLYSQWWHGGEGHGVFHGF